MMQETRDTDIITQSATDSINNETVTTLSEIAQNVAQVGYRGANSFGIVRVTNATGGEIVNSANYTFTSAGAIASTATSEYNSSNVNISYTYSHGDEAYESANLTITGIGTFADFWEIIVLAIVISVVIALLLAVFGGSRRR